MLFTGLPEAGWEAFWYGAVEEIADPDKALGAVAEGRRAALNRVRRTEPRPHQGAEARVRRGASGITPATVLASRTSRGTAPTRRTSCSPPRVPSADTGRGYVQHRFPNTCFAVPIKVVARR